MNTNTIDILTCPVAARWRVALCYAQWKTKRLLEVFKRKGFHVKEQIISQNQRRADVTTIPGSKQHGNVDLYKKWVPSRMRFNKNYSFWTSHQYMETTASRKFTFFKLLEIRLLFCEKLWWTCCECQQKAVRVQLALSKASSALVCALTKADMLHLIKHQKNVNRHVVFSSCWTYKLQQCWFRFLSSLQQRK